MRILVVGLNYAPELTGSGRYTSDFVRWLRTRGHQVRVVAAPPYYPAWRIAPGYHAGRYRRDVVDGVPVLRCPLWVPKRLGARQRLLHFLSFGLSSFWPCLLLAWRWRPQIVWTVEQTILSAPGALLGARLVGAKACLHCQDLQIEAALRLGALSSRLGRLARLMYRGLLRRFDLISTVSSVMRRQLIDAGVEESRLCLFPNWVDTGAIRPLKQAKGLRGELAIAPDQVVALYAGSMGLRQGLEVLATVARKLQERDDIVLVLCGDGPGQQNLERRLAGSANVRFLPVQPEHRLGELLSLADIHLLPQRPGNATFAMPSKLTGMLASGRPVIAQSDGGSEVDRLASHFGLAIPPGDADAMAKAILALADDPERRLSLGQAARAYATLHLERAAVIERYELMLRALGNSASRSLASEPPRPEVA